MAAPIRDHQGNLIGYQERDGTVRDKNNKKIGTINRRNGTVRDEQNREVGFIDSDGNVIDRYRRRLGTIGPDGIVHDWHGVPLYHGSAAPLLLNFEESAQPARDPNFNFDQKAREISSSPTTEFGRRTRGEEEPGAHHTLRSRLTREGFVSPSIFGCLGLIGAMVIGTIILYIFQNPSVLSPSVKPTANLIANPTTNPSQLNNSTSPQVEAPVTATAHLLTGKVNVDVLNLREGPDTNFPIVSRLANGTQVVLVGRLNSAVWIKVTVPTISKDGWVAAQYIDTEVDLATLPVIQAPSQ